MQPVVVKVGGSFFKAPERLASVCDALSSLSGPVAIVAGGGVYADSVRAAQRDLGFGDVTAHRMAIATMDLNGFVLCERLANGVAVSDASGFRSVFDRGRVGVWLPYAECRDDAELEASWDVTSDSIAGWLATRLGARGLLVVKSCEVDPAWPLGELVSRGVVDAHFPKIVNQCGLRWRVLGLGSDRCAARVSEEIGGAVDALMNARRA